MFGSVFLFTSRRLKGGRACICCEEVERLRRVHLFLKEVISENTVFFLLFKEVVFTVFGSNLYEIFPIDDMNPSFP